MADDPRFIERRDDDRGGDRGCDRDRDDRGSDRRGGSRDRGGGRRARRDATVAAADQTATATTTAAGARVHPLRGRAQDQRSRWAASTAVGSPTSWFGCGRAGDFSANPGTRPRQQSAPTRASALASGCARTNPCGSRSPRSSTRMALSMRDVDQRTGGDLLGGGGADARAAPARRTVPCRNGRFFAGSVRHSAVGEDRMADTRRRPVKRLSSPERWGGEAAHRVRGFTG